MRIAGLCIFLFDLGEAIFPSRLQFNCAAVSSGGQGWPPLGGHPKGLSLTAACRKNRSFEIKGLARPECQSAVTARCACRLWCAPPCYRDVRCHRGRCCRNSRCFAPDFRTCLHRKSVAFSMAGFWCGFVELRNGVRRGSVVKAANLAAGDAPYRSVVIESEPHAASIDVA